MPVASRSVGVQPATPAGVPMKARTTSTQPRSSEGDQAGRAADFIDSIGQKRTLQLHCEFVRLVPKPDIGESWLTRQTGRMSPGANHVWQSWVSGSKRFSLEVRLVAQGPRVRD